MLKNYSEISSTDLTKSQGILLYILQKTKGAFGHTKMMKTILLADQKIFRASYQTFSSYQYQRAERGPYSENFRRDLDILLEKGFISANVEQEKHPIHTYKFPLEGDLHSSYFFPTDEKATLNKAIEEISPLTTKEASERTHDRIYNKLKQGDNIPMYAYLEPYKPSEIELEKARELFNAD